MRKPKPTAAPAPHTMSQDITEKLMRRIVNGRYEVGSRLPTERELAVEFDVTRHVVREALKRLEAVGLVRIRQGSGIYVENLPLTGGVELFDVLLMNDDGSINLPLLNDILEFRGHMFRVVVRLAAVRRTPEELLGIRKALLERRAHPDDAARIEEIILRIFRLITQATHNRVYELIFNTMGRISVRLGALIDIPLMGFEQTQAILERIMDAFDHKDEEMADLLVSRYLNSLKETLLGKPGAAPPPGIA
jgi:GntR family transcriptional regulator, transcriptional repressor for pyruvate dehydrogenase complex